MVPAADVLTGAVPAGSDIVVVGGGLVGAETADYAAQQGASVTILEMGPTVAGDGEPVPNQFLLRNLRQRRVRVYTEAVCTEIEELGVRFTQGGRGTPDRTCQSGDFGRWYAARDRAGAGLRTPWLGRFP